eukprot:ctg_807.g423
MRDRLVQAYSAAEMRVRGEMPVWATGGEWKWSASEAEADRRRRVQHRASMRQSRAVFVPVSRPSFLGPPNRWYRGERGRGPQRAGAMSPAHNPHRHSPIDVEKLRWWARPVLVGGLVMRQPRDEGGSVPLAQQAARAVQQWTRQTLWGGFTAAVAAGTERGGAGAELAGDGASVAAYAGAAYMGSVPQTVRTVLARVTHRQTGFGGGDGAHAAGLGGVGGVLVHRARLLDGAEQSQPGAVHPGVVAVPERHGSGRAGGGQLHLRAQPTGPAMAHLADAPHAGAILCEPGVLPAGDAAVPHRGHQRLHRHLAVVRPDGAHLDHRPGGLQHDPVQHLPAAVRRAAVVQRLRHRGDRVAGAQTGAAELFAAAARGRLSVLVGAGAGERRVCGILQRATAGAVGGRAPAEARRGQPGGDHHLAAQPGAVHHQLSVPHSGAAGFRGGAAVFRRPHRVGRHSAVVRGVQPHSERSVAGGERFRVAERVRCGRGPVGRVCRGTGSGRAAGGGRQRRAGADRLSGGGCDGGCAPAGDAVVDAVHPGGQAGGADGERRGRAGRHGVQRIADERVRERTGATGALYGSDAGVAAGRAPVDIRAVGCGQVVAAARHRRPVAQRQRCDPARAHRRHLLPPAKAVLHAGHAAAESDVSVHAGRCGRARPGRRQCAACADGGGSAGLAESFRGRSRRRARLGRCVVAG